MAGIPHRRPRGIRKAGPGAGQAKHNRHPQGPQGAEPGRKWVLLDRLAAVLRTTKEELYRFYILRVGAFKDFHLPAEEAPTFREAWSRLGTGWITEEVDYTPDRENIVIRAYYGSSTYSTKRMSRLIDAVVGDCENQGIESKTPDELALMMARWGDAQAH